MPEAERRVPRAADLEARVSALEEEAAARDKKIDEIHAAVVGTTKDAGLGERIRDHDRRIARLESFPKWAAGIGTVVLGGLASAWATFAGGPPRPPHP